MCEQSSFLVCNGRGSTHEFHLQVPATDREIAAAVAMRRDAKNGALLAPQVYYTESLHVCPKNAL